MSEVIRAAETLRRLPDEDLEALCRRHSVRVMSIFGGAARSPFLPAPAEAPADLDIGVIFEPGSDHDILGLLEDLVQLLGTERIDILDAERASETARRLAIADGEPIYESEKSACANAAMAADALFMETAWMRRQALESLEP